ncbi:MAG: DMT family transporter [Acidobacteria bacterium]|nr:DMT family transporter [Acidobacteriota bacterium]MBV9477613.1 DMT family transporter [Acidobacteriota bacterium]
MRSPRFLACIAIVFWGVSFVATKAVLREIAPVTLIFLRFAIGAVVLLAIVRELPPRAAWPQLALMGFIGIFVHQMLQAYGLTMTAATNAGWLIGLTPIWSAVLSAIVLRERFGLAKIAGLLGGFAGALLVVTRGDFSSAFLARPSTLGDLLIFISTINWSIYSVVGHKTIRTLGPRRATSGAMLFGAAMLAPFFVARRGWSDVPHLSATGWGALLFLAVGCSALGYLFWYGALERIEVSRVASLLYAEPLVTFVAAALLLGERVSAAVVAGGLLVLVSVLVAQYGAGPAALPSAEEA